ncbi:MAG: ABC transporter permease [Planctomycetaceae bacterium]
MLRLVEHPANCRGNIKSHWLYEPEILWHYLKFGAVIGLIRGILGATTGFLFAGVMTKNVYAEYFEFPRLINRPYPGILLAGISISLIFAVLGSLRGVKKVMQLAPAEAMRPKPPVKGRRIWLEKSGPSLWK